MKDFTMCSVHEKFQSFTFDFLICRLQKDLKINRLRITNKSEIFIWCILTTSSSRISTSKQHAIILAKRALSLDYMEFLS